LETPEWMFDRLLWDGAWRFASREPGGAL
jgi:hypothetical protein